MGAFVADPAAVYAFVGRFFAALREAGARHVVVSPGSRSTPLAISARHTEGLRIWVELDERAAGFFALGLARATRRPAVLVCTSGTAAANYLPAVVEAHHARVPLIVATSDRPPEWRDWGAGQTIEQVGLYGRHPRWATDVVVPTEGEDARRHAAQLGARAFAAATGPAAGPVHLNWPLREPLPPPSGQLGALLAEASRDLRAPRFTRADAAPRREDVDELVALAREHERGVVCAGPMEAGPALRSAVAGFAAAAGWPVLADPAANLRAGPEAMAGPILDAGDALTRATAFTEAHRPSAVLRLGDPPVSKAQRLWLEASEPDAVVWLDQGGQWGEPSHRASRVIAGDAAALLDAATAALSSPRSASRLRERAWCRAFEAANERARKVLDEHTRADERFGGLAVAAAVARLAPPGAQLFASNSLSIRLLDLAFARRPDPLRVHCNRGASGIDGITSTALGTAAAEGTPTLLLTGDLAFLHDLSGLLLTRRERIPLTIVVIDDDGGGIFSMLPIAGQGDAVAFHELFHTPHGLDLARVAAAFELDYARAGDLATLTSAITRGLANDGVSIVHVPVEADAHLARFRGAIAAARERVDAEVGP